LVTYILQYLQTKLQSKTELDSRRVEILMLMNSCCERMFVCVGEVMWKVLDAMQVDERMSCGRRAAKLPNDVIVACFSKSSCRLVKCRVYHTTSSTREVSALALTVLVQRKLYNSDWEIPSCFPKMYCMCALSLLDPGRPDGRTAETHGLAVLRKKKEKKTEWNHASRLPLSSSQ